MIGRRWVYTSWCFVSRVKLMINGVDASTSFEYFGDGVFFEDGG